MKKRTIISIGLFGPILLLLFLGLFLVIFIKNCLIVKEEIARVASPDSSLDAVVVRINPGGAMSSYAYQVFIVPAGRNPRQKDEVLGGSRLDDIQVNWEEPTILEIRYSNPEAEIGSFQEVWKREKYEPAVEIRLITACEVLYKPLPSNIGHAEALTEHSISLVSYKILKGHIEDVLWPSETNPNFQLRIKDGKKERFCDAPAPSEFGVFEKDVTDDWSFEAKEVENETVAYLVDRKDGSTSIQVHLPLRAEDYDFSVLSNPEGIELVVFTCISDSDLATDLFGFITIEQRT